jgi:phospholipid transport system substrate-binding protein
MTRGWKCTALVLAVWAAPAAELVAQDAQTTLQEGMAEILAVTDNLKSSQGVADKIEPILVRRICFESMTRRALGPGWRQLTTAQQKEATRLFTKLIIRSYSKKFTPGEKAEVKYLKPSSPAPGKEEIPTTMLYKGGRYSIVYRMEDKGKWLVTDILVEGVSLGANSRAQFDDLFRKGGPSAVLNSLKESVSRT